MNDKTFFDTNILVYLFDRSDPVKSEKAVRLLRTKAEEKSGCISYQVLNEFFNVAFRRFPQPITTAEARLLLMNILGTYELVQSSHAILERAFLLRERSNFHWYDCLIVAAALEADCTILYTEDLQHGQKIDQLVVVNPFRA